MNERRCEKNEIAQILFRAAKCQSLQSGLSEHSKYTPKWQGGTRVLGSFGDHTRETCGKMNSAQWWGNDQFSQGKPADGDAFWQDEKSERAGNSAALVKESKEGRKGIWQDFFPHFRWVWKNETEFVSVFRKTYWHPVTGLVEV